METKKTYLSLLIIILFTGQSLYSQISEIVLGEEDLWKNTQLMNLVLIEGKRGHFDITNSDNEYQPDQYSDLILHLNSHVETDETGRYMLLNRVQYINSNENLGGGAAFFNGSDPLLIEAGNEGLFAANKLWNDFSFEFRLFPATLKEGSTVFLWKGLHKKNGTLIPQEIRCTVSNRQLVWDFENFFTNPDARISRLSLTGEKLIPQQWSHHLVSFDSETGLLEYRINNIPSDITYTTVSGRESRDFNRAQTGNQQSFPIELGENFTGLIDELRISSRNVEFPTLQNFQRSGFLETDIIDLKAPNCKIVKINSEKSIPGDTNIEIQYAVSNSKLDLLQQNVEWQVLMPDGIVDQNGQYVKIRAFFSSEPALSLAPVLSNLRVIFQRSHNPLPPVNITATRTDRGLQINWDRSIDPAVSGYFVYYGEYPDSYFSMGSPVNAGMENSIILTDLDENKRYYIAVTSYKTLNPRQESAFSREISVSP